MKKKITLVLLLAALMAVSLCAQPVPACPGPPDEVPPAESCRETCVYCGFQDSFYNYIGSNHGYAGNEALNWLCFGIQNDLWLGIIASGTQLDLTVEPFNCRDGNGIEVALYDDCNGVHLVCLKGSEGEGNVAREIKVSSLPGKNYFLIIDGVNGDVCDFRFKNPKIPPADTIGPIGPISGPSSICPGGTAFYEVGEVKNAGYYTWSGPIGMSVNGNFVPVTLPAPKGRKARIRFPSSITGVVNICVQAENSCERGPIQCKTIALQPIPPTVLPTKYVCFEDAPDPDCDDKKIYKSFFGCDSIVYRKCTILPRIQSNIGFQYICEGGWIEVCGNKIKEAGPIQQTCTSFRGCDSLVIGQLTVLDPVARILNKGGIACTGHNGMLTLNSAYSMSGTIKTWRRNGATMHVGESISITESGTYTLTARISLGGMICEQSDTAIIVFGEKGLPPDAALLSSSDISCLNRDVTLSVKSSAKLLNYVWSGPDVAHYGGAKPIVGKSGTYAVTVTDENGCTNVATVNVKADTSKPSIGIFQQKLLDHKAMAALICQTNAKMPRYTWAKNNAFFSDQPNPLIYEAGHYSLTVTDEANGCSATTVRYVKAVADPYVDNNPTGSGGLGDGLHAPLTGLWRIFPNPAKEHLTLEFSGAQLPEKMRIRMYDALGKLIRDEQGEPAMTQVLVLSNMPIGIYVLEISGAAQPERFRVWIY